ncbi:nucleotide exchange factor GrpE [Rhodococcus zopfii]|uniref:Protein GrpE n=1 Tax=Rhodococcus zopfii TaxID=43772 RepID=A0ABU3WK09_9NOCA|nr:nucleotide exchange factor GrpE [Rhodococcus zopfii]MDV2474273.1 nucleotide exchange factor GrpE [Rhodococcus zopfii]
MSAERPEQEPVTVTDKRRIDPDTFEVRDADAEAQVIEVETESAAPAAGDEAALTAEPSPETAELAERTADLQRVTAEYANYRRRIERERVAAIEGAKASVVGQFLDLVDDLDRARAHGDLEAGPMKALSDKLTGILTGLGLEGFGTEGDPFEPDLHEAVHMEGDGNHPVLGTVLRKGYRLGDRVLRHAMVTVTDGDPNDTPAQTSPDGSGTE